MDENECLFQMDAYSDRLPADAARIFAATHWEEPRRIAEIETGTDGNLLFKVENGVRTYVVKYIEAVPLRSLALYRIYVFQEG
jgi:hypothetical protein